MSLSNNRPIQKYYSEHNSNPMKFKSLTILITLLFVALFLSACAGGGAGTATGWPGLSADQDTAYLAYNREVFAINLADGTQKWQFPSKADNKITFYSAPTLTDDGQLLIGGYNNVLYSLNPQSGQIIWSFPALNTQTGQPDTSLPGAKDRYIGSTLARAQGIFAPNADNTLYAFDTKGNLLWQYQTEGPLWAKPTADPDCTCIYLTSMDHKLYSIDAETGKVNWTTGDLGGSIVGSPALSSNNILFIGTYGSQLIALDAETGHIIWQKNISELQGTPTVGQGTTANWVWGGPIIKGDRLYFGVQGGYFHILNAATGDLIGQPLKADGAITDSPLVTDDAVYFTTDAGSIYSLDLDGKGRAGWPIKLTNKLYTSPVSAGDLILIATTDSKQALVAFDTNGKQKWVFPPPPAPTPTSTN
jgi:outer membrane protein assembly factor BamB